MKVTDPQRNVVGIGLAAKLKGGREVAPEAVRFYVDHKIPGKSEIPQDHLLPETIDGLPTDVIEVGRIRCGAAAAAASLPHIIQPGTSCGVKFGRCGDGATGTVGAIVSRGEKRYLLSSAHVLARAHGFVMGAPILCPGPVELPLLAYEAHSIHTRRARGHAHAGQPGAHSLPKAEDFHRARLADYVMLSLDEPNHMDAGIAEITSPYFAPEILDIGALTRNTPFAALKGMPVMKRGLATGLTRGEVIDTDFDGRVDFPVGSMTFEDQFLIEGDQDSPFAWEGDSGALVVTRFNWDKGDNHEGEPETMAVALVVGFSMPESTPGPARSFCVASDLSLVLNNFEVDLMIA
jgi:hypothetical protein